MQDQDDLSPTPWQVTGIIGVLLALLAWADPKSSGAGAFASMAFLMAFLTWWMFWFWIKELSYHHAGTKKGDNLYTLYCVVGVGLPVGFVVFASCT